MPSPHLMVVDSGVGGLSIVTALRRILPACCITYVADSEGFPYGTRDDADISQRLLNLLPAVNRLRPCDAIIIACNTASTLVLPSLRATLAIPIVGVVPAIKPAALVTRSGHIGLLATPATIRRPYTDTLITEFAKHCTVTRLGSSRLVTMAESKLAGADIDPEELRHELAPLLGKTPEIDTLVLGCTHFPLLVDELQAALPASMALLDSGVAIAKRVQALLADALVAPSPAAAAEEDLYLLTGAVAPGDGFCEQIQQFGFTKIHRLNNDDTVIR